MLTNSTGQSKCRSRSNRDEDDNLSPLCNGLPEISAGVPSLAQALIKFAPTHWHGTTSAALVGILSRDYPGMKSLGKLVEEGGVSFAGECREGIAGISRIAISSMPVSVGSFSIDVITRYAMGQIKWTPRTAARRLRNYTEAASAFEKGEEPDRWVGPYLTCEENLAFCETIIEHESRRLKAWPGLSIAEKRLVDESFPVVAAIRYSGTTVPVYSEFFWEQGLCDDISLENIWLLVPEDRPEMVTALGAENGHTQINISSFTAMEPYCDSLQSEKALASLSGYSAERNS